MINVGALMYGPPGTGKTLLARACAAQTEATFLKLAGPQLVQMFIGDGAKLVRDCFALAKEKAPSIIFIDELDAIGTKRFDSDKSGDREVQRTMLELLNQLDGFASDDRIKVLAATNRIDVLDPALLRSGRLDRKIEFPLPNEEARAQILRIHSRKMTVDDAVNWPELARSTDEFGGAQLKAVCVEAGMIALRKGQSKIGHEHYVDAITEVQAKKKVCHISNLVTGSIDVLTLSHRTRPTSMLKRCATTATWVLGRCICNINGIEIRPIKLQCLFLLLSNLRNVATAEFANAYIFALNEFLRCRMRQDKPRNEVDNPSTHCSTWTPTKWKLCPAADGMNIAHTTFTYDDPQKIAAHRHMNCPVINNPHSHRAPRHQHHQQRRTYKKRLCSCK